MAFFCTGLAWAPPFFCFPPQMKSLILIWCFWLVLVSSRELQRPLPLARQLNCLSLERNLSKLAQVAATTTSIKNAFQCWRYITKKNVFTQISEKGAKIIVHRKYCLPAVKMPSTSEMSTSIIMSTLKPQDSSYICFGHSWKLNAVRSKQLKTLFKFRKVLKTQLVTLLWQFNSISTVTLVLYFQWRNL